MSRENRMLPAARPAADFLVETLADEVLIYDQRRQRAHCLTPAAAFVWRSCAEGRNEAEVRAELQSLSATDSLEAVLKQLDVAGLLVSSVAKPDRLPNRSRRALLGRGMVAGVVLASPVVFSIVAPSVANAASVTCGNAPNNCCGGDPTTHIGGSCNSPDICKGDGFCH